MKYNELKEELRKVNESIKKGNPIHRFYHPIEMYDFAVKKDKKVFDKIYPFYSAIAMEECAELSQAVSKAFRNWMDNPINDEIDNDEVKLNLCEEIAYVLMMIERIRCLYNLDSEVITKILHIKTQRYIDLVSNHWIAHDRSVRKEITNECIMGVNFIDNNAQAEADAKEVNKRLAKELKAYKESHSE